MQGSSWSDSFKDSSEKPPGFFFIQASWPYCTNTLKIKGCALFVMAFRTTYVRDLRGLKSH